MKTLQLCLSVCVMLFCLNAQAHKPNLSPQLNNAPIDYEEMYLELPENLVIKTDRDEKIIRYFIDFGCQYCAHLKDVMRTWSSTLTNGYKVIYHHIGISDSTDYFVRASALTYVMNTNISKDKKDEFMEHMFRHTPAIQSETQLQRLVKEASADIGLSFEPLGRYIMSQEALDDYYAAIELQDRVHVSVTPSLLVSGKYLTNLGLTDGRPESWIQLINKVTSIDYYTRQNQLITNQPLSELQVLPTKDKK